jgi:hypothetical protein
MQVSIGVFDENGEQCDVKTFSIEGTDRDVIFAFAQGIVEELRQSAPAAMFSIDVSPI